MNATLAVPRPGTPRTQPSAPAAVPRLSQSELLEVYEAYKALRQGVTSNRSHATTLRILKEMEALFKQYGLTLPQLARLSRLQQQQQPTSPTQQDDDEDCPSCKPARPSSPPVVVPPRAEAPPCPPARPIIINNPVPQPIYVPVPMPHPSHQSGFFPPGAPLPMQFNNIPAYGPAYANNYIPPTNNYLPPGTNGGVIQQAMMNPGFPTAAGFPGWTPPFAPPNNFPGAGLQVLNGLTNLAGTIFNFVLGNRALGQNPTFANVGNPYGNISLYNQPNTSAGWNPWGGWQNTWHHGNGSFPNQYGSNFYNAPGFSSATPFNVNVNPTINASVNPYFGGATNTFSPGFAPTSTFTPSNSNTFSPSNNYMPWLGASNTTGVSNNPGFYGTNTQTTSSWGANVPSSYGIWNAPSTPNTNTSGANWGVNVPSSYGIWNAGATNTASPAAGPGDMFNGASRWV